MKKIFLFLLTMMYTASAIADDSGSCGNNLTWTFESETGTLTISGTGQMNDFATWSAPWYQYKKTLKKAVFETGLTHIGNCAFMSCEALTSVDIPNSLTSIGDLAFLPVQDLRMLPFQTVLQALADNLLNLVVD